MNIRTANLPPALQRPLVFGDYEQIEALQSMEKTADEEEQLDLSPVWEVECQVWDSLVVRADSSDEAKVKAKRIFWDDLKPSDIVMTVVRRRE